MLTQATAQSSSPDTEVLYEGEGCLFGTWKNVFVAVWTTQATGHLASVLGKATGEFSKAHPEGISFIHVIGNSPPLPTAEARTTLVRKTQALSKELACVGTVLEGSGFWASAVRSFIFGIRLVVPWTFELQIYATVAEVAAWLPPLHAKKTGVTLDSAELARALVTLRRRLP